MFAGLSFRGDPMTTADERRLLEILAGSDEGCTDAFLTAQGFPLKVILGVIGNKFATTQAERTFAAGKPVDVARVRITDAGRRTLAPTARDRYAAEAARNSNFKEAPKTGAGFVIGGAKPQR
jgi:hypothetical protein